MTYKTPTPQRTRLGRQMRTNDTEYLKDTDWCISRMTELLLMGHGWKQVRDFMLLSKPEFDSLLDRAIAKAQAEQRRVEAEFREMA